MEELGLEVLERLEFSRGLGERGRGNGSNQNPLESESSFTTSNRNADARRDPALLRLCEPNASGVALSLPEAGPDNKDEEEDEEEEWSESLCRLLSASVGGVGLAEAPWLVERVWPRPLACSCRMAPSLRSESESELQPSISRRTSESKKAIMRGSSCSDWLT